MPTTPPSHFMRFGIHSEKQYFLEPGLRACYDGVALNGNLVAYSLKGVCSFIANLLMRDKPYFIDPITHAFGHHPQYISKEEETGKLVPKAAIKALAELYGEPATTHIGVRALAPEDFEGPLADDFTQRVLDFQANIINQALQDSGDAKYIDAYARTPYFLIAPYFYLGPNSVELWIDLNLRFVDLAAASGRALPIYAEILVAKDAFLDPAMRDLLVSRYANAPADGILLWIEGFSEHSASRTALKGYRDFVERLAQGRSRIVVMYGGYFSVILRKVGVAAVCHGPGYGEEREVTPVGGGLPRPKFYYPALHMRLPHREVAFAFSQGPIQTADEFYKNVCNCKTCRQVVGDDIARFARYGESESGVRKDGIAFEYATTAARKISTAHYIYNKCREFEFVEESTLQEIEQRLGDEHARSQSLFGVNEAAHLEAWHNALPAQDVTTTG